MKSKKKISLTLGIMVLFFAAFVLLVIYPFLSKIKKNAQELEVTKNKIVSLAAEIDNLAIVGKQYQDYRADFDKIDSLFVNSEMPIDFNRFLEKLAEDSGVSVKISSGSGEKGQPWPALYYQLSAESTFLNLSRFLEKLENSTYLIRIQNLNIGQAAGQEKEEKISANLSIQVFAK